MAQDFTRATQRFLQAHKGFTLIELGVVLTIVAIVITMASAMLWNTESADAALVRSVQTQLQSGASQAAMLTGTPPNDNANIITLETYILSQLDPSLDATLDGDATGIRLRLHGTAKAAEYTVDNRGRVAITNLTGFSRYTVAGGEIVAL